mgnify:CR=1 FL=1
MFLSTYVSNCVSKNFKVLSYSYLFENILKDDNIWFSSDEIICPDCKKYEILSKRVDDLNENEQIEFNKSKEHIQNFTKQYKFYIKVKEAIANGQYSTDTILIVQDFSQIRVQKGDFYQDLILTYYYYENNEFKHQFKHFISNDKNDNFNVIHTWGKLLKTDDLLNKMKQIIIFSDGCIFSTLCLL